MLRENGSLLFFSLCRAFMEVAFPHCTKCFGRGYPDGAAFIAGAKKSFDGISRLLSVSLSRESPKPIINTGGMITPKNANLLVVENGLSPPVEQKENDDVNDKELSSDNSQADRKDGDL